MSLNRHRWPSGVSELKEAKITGEDHGFDRYAVLSREEGPQKPQAVPSLAKTIDGKYIFFISS